MWFRWLSVAAVLLLACGFASAQPEKAPGNTEPTIELRLRSVNDLVDRAEYVAELAGKEDSIRQLRELIKALSAEGKGIEGVDPKKPIGAYATLVKQVETSPFVVMLPIADEEQFIKALNKHLSVTAEKGDDGTYKLAVPILNEMHLRFTNGYVYASPKAQNLDPKALISPKVFFAKDDGSVFSLIAHIDRIPPELRTFVLGQFELGVNEERKKNAGNETAAEKRLKNLVFETIVGGAKGIAEDGKELSVKLFVDAKSDELSAEVKFSARSGSQTAKNFAALASRGSVPASMVGAAEAPAAKGNIKLAITEGMKKEYREAIDELLAQAAKDAPPDAEPVVKELIAAVAPTLKAGELDVAAALVGPDAKNHYNLLAALSVKEGKGIEKLLKDLVKQYGQFIEAEVEIKFDVETVGDFHLHRIELKNAPEKFQTVFGTKVVWLATSDANIAVSIEPEGELIRKGLKAKAIPVPVVSVDVSAAKLLPLAQPNLKPDERKALLQDAFGDRSPKGKDAITLRVEGGDTLSAKLKVKGKVIRLGVGLDLLRGK